MGLIRILHTNDLHGKLTEEKSRHLLQLRGEVDLYFDSGDAIRSGNLAIPTHPDPVWPLFAKARITASTPGNRESHVLKSVVNQKFEGSTHPVLCANWKCKQGELFFPSSTIFEVNSLKVGVFGVMVPMVTKKMITASASQFLWTNPLDAAKKEVQNLRSQVDLLIALTHIGFTQDQLLAKQCPDIDLILGGHSHTVLDQPVTIDSCSICQTGSHGRYLGVYDWSPSQFSGKLIPWEKR